MRLRPGPLIHTVSFSYISIHERDQVYLDIDKDTYVFITFLLLTVIKMLHGLSVII